MTVRNCCEIMRKVNIRPTAIRVVVYEAIQDISDTFSLTDLEDILDEIDKSSIFRTLTLFREHHLIHRVDDGSGFLKYCMCHNHGECESEERHCHFYCKQCQKTYCLEKDIVPEVSLPESFQMQEVNYVAKGICSACSKKIQE